MTSQTPAFETISVIGLGYIGLPTAATIASRGVNVVGVDVKQEVVDLLNRGEAHFSEPDLDALLAEAVRSGALRGSVEPEPADAYLIAVPTPFQADKSADLTYVERAARSIAKVLRKGDLVILESTSPVGTTSSVCKWIAEERPDLQAPDGEADGDFHVAYCPERILPGQMVRELVQNDRIVGGMSRGCAERAAELYSLFVKGTLFRTRAPVAETVKLVENAYRDVNIAFANELSMQCDEMGIDVFETIALANRHPRVDILNPGPGVGGHCIAVDPWFLISAHPDSSRLMESARMVNDGMPETVLAKIREHLGGGTRKTVACLGLAYKPDIDDLRESPAITVTRRLVDEAAVIAVEPHIGELPLELSKLDNIELCDLDRAIELADIVVVLVGHSAFRDIDRSKLAGKAVIDTVGLWKE